MADIETVGDFLRQIIEREQDILAGESVTHGPTIGDMYEGLTAEVVGMSLPEGFDLRVVSGFVTDGDGETSRQQDCMVVVGDGRRIPHTSAYEYHVSQVFLIVEVKKSVHKSEIEDAWAKYSSVSKCWSAWAAAGKADLPYSPEPGERAVAEMAQQYRTYGTIQQAPFDVQMVFHAVMANLYEPLYVVLGYSGFKSEKAFRDSMWGILEANVLKKGYGPGSFPALIIAGEFTLVKCLGMPWSGPIFDGWWHFFNSTQHSPVHLLLEVLWTRLGLWSATIPPWGDDLEIEVFNRFLSARPVENDDGDRGWTMRYHTASEDVLDLAGATTEAWQPSELTEIQWIVLQMMQTEQVGPHSTQFRDLCDAHGVDPNAEAQVFLATGLVAMRGDFFCVITDDLQTAILPDGRIVGAPNNTGRLTRWISDQV